MGNTARVIIATVGNLTVAFLAWLLMTTPGMDESDKALGLLAAGIAVIVITAGALADPKRGTAE